MVKENITLKKQIPSPISKHQSCALCNLITGLLLEEGIKFPLKPLLVDKIAQIKKFYCI